MGQEWNRGGLGPKGKAGEREEGEKLQEHGDTGASVLSFA